MKSQTILVVDDDCGTLRVMKELLEAGGYTVVCATNGREALEHLERAEPPFAILLDLSMPVMTGWEFREHQRQTATVAHIPVLIISGEQDLPQIAAALGVAGHFRKPVPFDELLDAMRALPAA